MKLIDVQHPWFIPMYRRVLVVALCLGWAGVEIYGGNGFWAVLFGALGVYCAYQFFVVFNPVMPVEKPAEPPADPSKDSAE